MSPGPHLSEATSSNPQLGTPVTSLQSVGASPQPPLWEHRPTAPWGPSPGTHMRCVFAPLSLRLRFPDTPRPVLGGSLHHRILLLPWAPLSRQTPL